MGAGACRYATFVPVTNLATVLVEQGRQARGEVLLQCALKGWELASSSKPALLALAQSKAPCGAAALSTPQCMRTRGALTAKLWPPSMGPNEGPYLQRWPSLRTWLSGLVAARSARPRGIRCGVGRDGGWGQAYEGTATDGGMLAGAMCLLTAAQLCCMSGVGSLQMKIDAAVFKFVAMPSPLCPCRPLDRWSIYSVESRAI